MKKYYQQQKENAPALAGIILLIIGGIWLLGELHIRLPFWLLKPYTLLIGIGLYLGAKRNFQAPFGWMVPLGIGICWVVSNLFGVNLWKFGFPLALIGAGIYIVINAYAKPKVDPLFTNDDDKKKDEFLTEIPLMDNANIAQEEPSFTTTETIEPNAHHAYDDNVINATGIFSGIKKTINSKNFKGGDITAVMGGVDINLSYADMPSPAVIDLTVMMGGVTLVIPSGWEVKNNVTCILGGVEERRPPIVNTGNKKILVLNGTVIMGGIDIRNY
jgi:predicted membrane protein